MSRLDKHNLSSNLSSTLLIGEQAKWRMEEPDKLGEALAEKHLEIIREATQKSKPKPKSEKKSTPKRSKSKSE
jgi:hypothetical protein